MPLAIEKKEESQSSSFEFTREIGVSVVQIALRRSGSTA